EAHSVELQMVTQRAPVVLGVAGGPLGRRSLWCAGQLPGVDRCCRAAMVLLSDLRRSYDCVVCGRCGGASALAGDSAGLSRWPSAAQQGHSLLADPPTVEEIVAVMRHARDDRHGWRVRAVIV